MKSFVRVTTLSSISGRAGYMSDPGRQEEIVIESESIDWEPYEKFERENQRSAQANNAGREVMVTMPNEWYQLDRAELHHRVDILAKQIAGDREHQWAVHWNKARTNFHVHIVFSERQKVAESGVWDRNVYASKDGKVARRKADRAVDENGEYILLHRKGEAKEPFSAKDTKFTTKEWLHELKQDLKQTMIEQWGVKFEKLPPLHEYHEGNGSDAPIIRMKNMVIRENNARLEALESRGYNIAKYVKTLTGLMKDGKIPVMYLDGDKLRATYFTTPEKAIALMEQTKGQILPAPPRIEVPPLPNQEVDQEEPEHLPPAAPAEPIQQPPEAAAAVQKDDAEQERVAPAPAATKLPEQPSSKKEDTKEPAAPVERRSLMDLIRDLIATIAAKRAAKKAVEQTEQAPLPVEPEPEPVVVVRPASEPQQERYRPLDERIETAKRTAMPSDKAIRMEDWKTMIEADKTKKQSQPDHNRKPKSHDRSDR